MSVADSDSLFDALTALPGRGLRSYGAPMMFIGQDLLMQRSTWISGNSKRMMFHVP